MEPFMGQIMQVGFSYAPRGWMTCQGQLLAIAQQSALFSLLGTTFGGNGQNTFGLPDARGRTFVGTGQGPGLQPYSMGQIGGIENTTLLMTNMPMHNHTAVYTPAGGSLTGQVQAKSGIAPAQLSNNPTEGCFLANTSDPEIGGTPLIYASRLGRNSSEYRRRQRLRVHRRQRHGRSQWRVAAVQRPLALSGAHDGHRGQRRFPVPQLIALVDTGSPQVRKAGVDTQRALS